MNLLSKVKFLLFLIVYAVTAQAQTPIEKKIRAAGFFFAVNFWQQVPGSNDEAAKYANSYSVYHLDVSQLQQLLSTHPDNISFSVSVNGTIYPLLLTKNDIRTPDFSVGTSGENNFDPAARSLNYHGIVEGTPGSVASVSFFENDIVGVLSTPAEGNLVIGKLGEATSREYVFYNDKDLKIQNNFKCQVDDDAFRPKVNKRSVAPGDYSCKVTRMYYEADSLLYKLKNKNVTTVVNFITGMFNNISTLYFNEGLHLQLSRIYVWTTKDPYSITSSHTALNLFTSMRGDTISGDLAQLLSTNSNSLGGLAWLDVLCGNGPESYVNIDGTYNTFPTYSWNIEAMSHESGHNFGSPHTHNCTAWVGGPIDWCAPTYDIQYKEGNCTSGPLPVKGTVMSYCHLVSSIGINLALGFGPQPGDLIRTAVGDAQCLGSYPNFSVKVLSDSIVTCDGNTIAVRLDSSSSRYRFQWQLDGADLIADTTGHITAVNGGTYTCELTTSDGCIVSSNSRAISFYMPDASITPAGSVEICTGDSVHLAAVSPQAEYSWSGGEISQDIWVKAAGIYDLTITDIHGCMKTSAPVTISEKTCFPAGIATVGLDDLTFFPNPVSEVLTVTGSILAQDGVALKIYDVTGREMFVSKETGENKVTVRTANLPSGIYVLSVAFGQKTVNKRFVKE